MIKAKSNDKSEVIFLMEGLSVKQVRERKPKNIVLQERDKAVIKWLSRVGMASANQVARLFGWSEEPILRRLQKLREAGRVGGKKNRRRLPGHLLVQDQLF